MASQEDILIFFKGQDGISPVVQSIESTISSAFSSISGELGSFQSTLSSVSDSLNIVGESAVSLSNDINTISEESIMSVSTVVNELGTEFETADASATVLSNEITNIDGASISQTANDTKEFNSNVGDATRGVSSLSSSINNVSGGGISNVTNSVQGLGSQLLGANEAVNQLSTSLNNVNGMDVNVGVGGGTGEETLDTSNVDVASLMYIANQVKSLGGSAENMAQGIDDAQVSLNQLSIMSGVARPELERTINTITDATFSHDDAFMYIKNLHQMGVESDNFAKSASDMNAINDALGLGAQTTNSLVTELAVLGVDANNVSDSFNALAYANSNTKGGMENYYSFLRKYDAQFKELGFDVDQASIIISGATQKYGGGRAALAGLSTALKESGGDARALEQALDLESGSLDKASEITGQYKGQLEELAGEQIKHRTLTQHLGAIWEDISLSISPVLGPLSSFGGLLGQAGSYAIGINALSQLTDKFRILAKGDGISGAISKLKQFTGLSNTIPSSGPTVGVPKNVGGTKQIANTTREVVKDASVVGGLAPEAATAATGIEATATASSGIATAFTSMIVPLLAIAAVIAVMIPIVAGLAAEALGFLKLIQMWIDALNFDDIDLSKSIEGIKQIGQAMVEMGIAMGAMTFATLLSTYGIFITALTSLINPIQTAGRLLVNVANELKMFENVKIDSSVPETIKSISEALGLVSSAMSDLVQLSLSMAWGNIITSVLGGVSSAIRNARLEIVNAGKEIAQIKDVPDLDTGAVDKLEKVSSALDSIGKAYEGLTKIRDQYNWDTGWFGGWFQDFNISESIDGIKDTIVEASGKLAVFEDVKEVPEGIGEKLSGVSSALESLAKAMESLKSIKDQYNWDNGWLGGWFQDFSIEESISGVKKTLVSVSNSLKSFDGEGGLATIPEGLNTKLSNITSVLSTLADATKNLKDFPVVSGDEIPLRVQKAVTVVRNSSRYLTQLNGTANVSEETTGKIRNVGTATNALKSTINPLKTFPVVSGNEIPLRVQKAVTAVKATANQLRKLQGTQGVGGISGILSSVRNAVIQLRNTLNGMRGGFHSTGVNIGSGIKSGIRAGLGGLAGAVSSQVSSATNQGVASGNSGGARIGTSAVTGFKSTFKLASVVSSEMTFSQQAVTNGTPGVVNAVHDMAQKAVDEAKAVFDQHSPGKIARMMGDEMDFSTSLINSRGLNVIKASRDMSRRVVGAWNPNLSTSVGTLTTNFNRSMIGNMRDMNRQSDMGAKQRPVNIVIGEGAIKLDARNLSKTECRQIMINALEGLENIRSIDIMGV